MAIANDLMGVGMPAAQASLVGVNPAAVTAAGTAQTTATVLKANQTFVTLTTASSQDSVRLPTDAPLGTMYILMNNSSTTANVFPPSGAKINNAADDAAVTITVNLGRIFVRRSLTRWVSWVAA